VTAALAGIAAKIAADAVLARRLRGAGLPLRSLLWIPVKDLVIAALWSAGLCKRTICWRGHRLRVEAGSRLTPVADEAAPAAGLAEEAV